MGYAAGDKNLYRYVDNNPTDETDPSGLDAVDDIAPFAILPLWPFQVEAAKKYAEWRSKPPTADQIAAQAALWAPPKGFTNAEGLRTAPKYTKHDVEWYAELTDVTIRDRPRTLLLSYVGFGVEVQNGKPTFKGKGVISGVHLTAPTNRNVVTHSQYSTSRFSALDGTEELRVTYVLTVTDQKDPWYSAKLEAKWKFTVKDNKLTSEFLGVTPTVADPDRLKWQPMAAPGKTNQETFTNQWQAETAASGLYGPKK